MKPTGGSPTTALVLGLELVAGDGIFEGVRGLTLHCVHLG